MSGKADKTELEALAEEVAKKANTDGYYGGMTVGSAENLVGRGSVEAEIQGIRTSAGQEDIGTGAAIIREVRGKSLVWNQLVDRISLFRNVTQDSTVSDLTITAAVQRSNGYTSAYLETGVPTEWTHKYFVRLKLTPSSGLTFRWSTTQYGQYNNLRNDVLVAGEMNVLTRIATGNYKYMLFGWDNATIGDTITFSSYEVIDLTLLFGAGNEPATVEEFEARYPLPFYEHNAGTIINNEATGLRTRGFNLFNPVTGKAVLPGKYSDYPYEYEICGTFTSISFEDYAGNVSTPELTDGRFFNIPSPGVLTVVGGNATDTCVHLVWSGWRNYGEPDYVYEPYWENTLQINIKTITGKLNGEGESVTIFPDGMRSAGSAYDRLIVDPDGFARRAVKVMESVDLGTLGNAWELVDAGNTHERFQAFVTPRMKSISVTALGNILCSKYAIDTAGNIYAHVQDKTICSLNGYVQVYDSSYSSQAAFIAAMSGVELVYELATPLEYVLDTPIQLTYMVDDFGTEAKLPVDTAELPTGPLRFAVTYPFNAVDKLRRLSTNYLSKESTEAMLNALQSAGIISGYTMTYNASTEQYTFTITPPSTTPDETTE